MVLKTVVHNSLVRGFFLCGLHLYLLIKLIKTPRKRSFLGYGDQMLCSGIVQATFFPIAPVVYFPPPGQTGILYCEPDLKRSSVLGMNAFLALAVMLQLSLRSSM